MPSSQIAQFPKSLYSHSCLLMAGVSELDPKTNACGETLEVVVKGLHMESKQEAV